MPGPADMMAAQHMSIANSTFSAPSTMSPSHHPGLHHQLRHPPSQAMIIPSSHHHHAAAAAAMMMPHHAAVAAAAAGHSAAAAGMGHSHHPHHLHPSQGAMNPADMTSHMLGPTCWHPSNAPFGLLSLFSLKNKMVPYCWSLPLPNKLTTARRNVPTTRFVTSKTFSLSRALFIIGRRRYSCQRIPSGSHWHEQLVQWNCGNVQSFSPSWRRTRKRRFTARALRPMQ